MVRENPRDVYIEAVLFAASQGAGLFFPLVQVASVTGLPFTGRKVSPALMNQSKRDGSHAKVLPLSLSAKVEIVKVEIESFVELDFMLSQDRIFCREENAIHKFARLAGRAEAGDRARKLLSMPDDATEI